MLPSTSPSVFLALLLALAGCGKTEDSNASNPTSGGSPTAGGTSSLTGGGSAFAGAGGSNGSDAATCPVPVWTPTSVSFSYQASGEYVCDEYDFSKQGRTLSYYSCTTPSWLVYLSPAQFDAVIEAASSVQAVCEPDPQCIYSYDFSSLSVSDSVPDPSPTKFASCGPRDTDAATMVMTPSPPYLPPNNALSTTIRSIIESSCNLDAGGGKPGVCVPMPGG